MFDISPDAADLESSISGLCFVDKIRLFSYNINNSFASSRVGQVVVIHTEAGWKVNKGNFPLFPQQSAESSYD